MEFVLAAVIGVLIFVIFELVRKEARNEISTKAALLIQVLWLVRFFVFYVKVDLEGDVHPLFIIYDQTFFLLDGPLIWFYTRTLIEKNPFAGRCWLHFIPFGVFFFYSTFLLIFYPQEIVEEYQNSIKMIEAGQSFVDFFDLIYIVLFLGISLIYLFKSVGIAKSYNRRLEENYSTVDNLTATWIITFQRMWLVLFLIPIVLYFMNYIWPIFNTIDIAGLVMLALLLFSLFFSSNLMTQVYKPVGSLQRVGSNATKTLIPNAEDLEKLKRQLSTEKYYLDEELSLQQLADFMQMRPVELTELIKSSEYDNFYDLINSYRIEEIKAHLRTSNEQIIQLAYQNGFKSKSTFNKIFKEKTGLTPKEYRLSAK